MSVALMGPSGGNGKITKVELVDLSFGRYSGSFTKTVDVSSYKGYKKFTEDNFTIIVTSVYMGDSNAYAGSDYSLSYDAETGIVTFSVKTKTNANGGYHQHSASAKGYLFY
nr:MAG TPA: hypothetical protein [Caudoviricetes sp.]